MAKQNAGSGGGMLTLTEVAKRTGISMPTLQKYKKQHAERIPSKGKGRLQRYPEESLAVWSTLRDENMARRGRPRKDAAAKGPKGSRRRGRPGRPKRGARKGSGGGQEGMLTLTQVGQRTGISYPTLLRYVKTSLDRLPHQGSGRRRRFKPESVEVFQQMRKESRPGRPPGSGKGGRRAAAAGRRGRRTAAAGRATGGAAATARLERTVKGMLKKLEQRIARIEREQKRPLRIVRR